MLWVIENGHITDGRRVVCVHYLPGCAPPSEDEEAAVLAGVVGALNGAQAMREALQSARNALDYHASTFEHAKPHLSYDAAKAYVGQIDTALAKENA